MEAQSISEFTCVFAPRDAVVAELRAALLVAQPFADVRQGAHCTGISHCPGSWLRVQVDKSPALDAEIVLGCDGVHSQVREALSGNTEAVSRAWFVLRGFDAASAGLQFRTMCSRTSPCLQRPAGARAWAS